MYISASTSHPHSKWRRAANVRDHSLDNAWWNWGKMDDEEMGFLYKSNLDIRQKCKIKTGACGTFWGFFPPSQWQSWPHPEKVIFISWNFFFVYRFVDHFPRPPRRLDCVLSFHFVSHTPHGPLSFFQENVQVRRQFCFAFSLTFFISSCIEFLPLPLPLSV